MYYINKTPSENGNYGNPMGQPFPGCLELPDMLLEPYLNAKGFVILTTDEDMVTTVKTNTEALAEYEKSHPASTSLPPTETEIIEQEITGLHLADIEQGQFATDLQLQILEGQNHV